MMKLTIFVAIALLLATASAKPAPSLVAAPVVAAAYTAPVVSAYSAYSAPLVYSDVAVSEPLVNGYYSPYAYAYTYYR